MWAEVVADVAAAVDCDLWLLGAAAMDLEMKTWAAGGWDQFLSRQSEGRVNHAAVAAECHQKRQKPNQLMMSGLLTWHWRAEIDSEYALR